MSFIRRTRKKFGYAFKGLKIAFTSDNSFKVHFAVAIPVIASGFFLDFNSVEWIIISFAIGQVLVAELFNTAIEYLVRMFTDQYHELAEKLLDISAGAVLMATIVSVVVGMFTYYHHFF